MSNRTDDVLHDCAIAQDLMPLVQEDLASPQSKHWVAEHIKNCTACKAEWAQMQTQSMPVFQEALPLQHISHGLRRRRWLWALMLMSLALAVALAFTAFATDKQYVPYEEGLLDIRQDGQVVSVQATRPGMYVDVSLSKFPDAANITMVEISLYTRRLDVGRQEGLHQANVMLQAGARASAWYVEPGRSNRFMYGVNPIGEDGGIISLPRLALWYYVQLAMAVLVVLLVLLALFWKLPRLRKYVVLLLGLPLAYLAGHFLVKGFSTLSYYSLGRDLAWIAGCAAFLYLAYLLWGAYKGWFAKKVVAIH